MSRPNRCIKDEDGTELWISRSSVVIPMVFKLDIETGDIYTLLEQRGKAVTHTGEWCCPCGYIDWDETLEEACQREVMEETSIQLRLEDIIPYAVSTNKHSPTQAINHFYICWAGHECDIDMDKIITKDEILDVKWLKVGKLEGKLSFFMRWKEKCIIYKKSISEGFGNWAFKEHKEFILEALKHCFRTFKIDIIDE